ncbi:hypothetical protein Hanom_Chr07g00626481 [Helianthus anomalus]
MEKTFVEGEVHMDSSSTESDIDPTMIAPTSYVSGKKKLKKSSKKKKASDEEDATYVPTPVEKEKLKKKGIKKRKACPTGELPRRINTLTRKVSILENGKAKVEAELKETKEKLGDIEAENVALRVEVEEQSEVIEGLVDKIMELRAQYKSMDESHQMLMEVVGNLHTSTPNENEVLKKEVEALRADKEIKDEQLNMLYTVIEHKLGINVQAVYDEMEIQRVEARRIEREMRLAEEAAKALKDKKKGSVIDTEELLGSSSQQEQPKPDDEADVNVEVSLDIVAIGEFKDVPYIEWASLRKIEVERR